MLDINLEEKLVEKVGGKFKLTRLIQQRLIELNRGATPLVEAEELERRGDSAPNRSQDLMKIVVREILEEKISLAPKKEIEPGYEEKVALQKEEAAFTEELRQIKEERVKELTGFLQPKE